MQGVALAALQERLDSVAIACCNGKALSHLGHAVCLAAAQCGDQL